MVATIARRGVNASAAIKVPCIAASTANLTLEAEQTVDGIALVEGNRCFAKDQTDTTENGIYKVSTGTWEREPDFDGAYDVVEGTIIPVSRGTANADTYWKVTNTGDITIGTTALTFQATTVLDSAILNDGSVKMIADFSPQVTDTYDLGTSSLKWEELHLNGNALIGGTLGVTGVATFTEETVVAGVTQPSIPAQVSNHTRAGNIQIYNGTSAQSIFVASSSITVDTWETVGPTGSGATNIWTAMDLIPANATVLLVDVSIWVIATHATNDATGYFYATQGDEAAPSAIAQTTNKATLRVDNDTIGDSNITHTPIMIPLEPTAQDFQARWGSDDSTTVISLYYRGFITD